MTGTVTASATARHNTAHSSSDSTGPSPVVPDRTNASDPCPHNQRARVTAPSTSSAPSSSKGVTMAVTTDPNRPVPAGDMTLRIDVRAASTDASSRVRSIGTRKSGSDRLALRRGLEAVVLLAGVGPVLEGDDTEVGEAVPQPTVGGVEQTELLAVRHDLREQQALEDLPFRNL